MKNKFIIALLTATMLVLLAGCGDSQASLSSVTVETHEETQTLEGQNATVQLSYPVVSTDTSSEAADTMIAKLNEQFRKDADTFLKQVETESLAAGTTPQYKAEVVYNQDGLLSVVRDAYPVDGNYQRYAATYNLMTDGAAMTLGEITDLSEDDAEALVVQQFGGVIQTDPDTFHDDAAEYVQTHLEQLQYYRSTEGLTIFFQAGAIASADAGVLEIVLG